MNIRAKIPEARAGTRVLHDLVDKDPVRIRYAEGTGSDLVISFSSIGRKRNQMPPDEFLGTVLGDPARHALFVSDLSRSWMNDPTLRDALSKTVTTLVKKTRIARVSTLGLSLGAFSALTCSTLFPVHAALAISPQFSMQPGAIKGERRWTYWRKQIKDFDVETAEVTPPPAMSFLLHGLENDTEHMRAFTPRGGLDQFGFEGQSHSTLGAHLKDANVLPMLLSAAINHDRRRVARLVKQADGDWRGAFED